MQQKAIMHESGPVMCLAGPGSGKTFVLTYHIKYLIEELNVEPSKILVITFSKAAAKEMQQRFVSIMGNQILPVKFGTFHAIFFHMLCQHQGYSANSIISLQEKKKYLKIIIQEIHSDLICDQEILEEILQKISFVKNRGIELGFKDLQMNEYDFEKIFYRYQKMLFEHRKLDFEDMMLLCQKMLNDHSQILSFYQEQFQYILIDEYQDINSVQYDIIKKLIIPKRNLFVVGDDDQAIYSFRGSDPSIMLQFKTDFPDGEIITFPINYRSVESVVNCANKLIKENKARYKKEIKAKQCHQQGIHFYEYETMEQQQADIISLIKRQKNAGIYDSCAILLRTNVEASFWAELLLKEKLSYRMKEKINNIYDSFICRDLLCYLRLARGSCSTEDLVTIMNRPLRYLSRGCVNGKTFRFDDLKNFYFEKTYMLEKINQLEYELKWLSKMDIFSSINYIRKGIGYEDYLKTLSMEHNMSYEKWFDILNELHRRMGMFHTVSQLERHIEEYSLLLSKQHLDKTNEGITIMTYHASKGLEFEEVILPNCNEGYTPHRKCEGEKGMEEERRLFYVAMTRAKKQLHICYVKGNKDNKHLVSRFVRELK